MTDRPRDAGLRNLTAEQRVRQAVVKTQVMARRNLRLFLAGEIDVLPEVNERDAIISEMRRMTVAFANAGRANIDSLHREAERKQHEAR